VLYAYGGPFKRGFKAPDAEIYDVVPTVLRSMGLPLPHVFDGRVLDEMLSEEKQPSRAAEAAADSRLAYNKLRKLLEV
jgi:arylsulfatase A-like enzyme